MTTGLTMYLRQMGLRLLLVNIMLATAAVIAQAAGPERPIRIVAFGDSLTAGYGLKPGEAFPVQLERRLKAKGHAVEVANAGVSGDTTAGGLARLDWVVPNGTDAVIVELGANDALRGHQPADARRNLDQIVARLRARGIDVLVAGMQAPRNLGPEYSRSFDPIFKEIADRHGALLYPFFLAGVALDPRLNLADGIHPNAQGVSIIADRILPSVEELIGRVKTRLARAGRG